MKVHVHDVSELVSRLMEEGAADIHPRVVDQCGEASGTDATFHFADSLGDRFRIGHVKDQRKELAIARRNQ